MTGRLATKHILVTGAATGIGRAIAEACVREGAKVALLDQDGDSVERLAAELRSEGHNVQALMADIADRAMVDAAVVKAREKNGPLTTLINNAGMNVFYEPLAMPDEAWQRCLAVDLEGAWYCTRSLGIEYAPRGVRVNAIAPGYINTPAVEAHWQTFDDPAAAKASIEALLPPGRLGQPEEVAMTVVFLASDESPFINASCLTIDGGRSVVYHD